jgi:uncharacterized protein YbjT (DUF2867 family)
MILVTGATGTVGREVVKQLVAAGERVRALTRDATRAKFGPGVEVVVGDLESPAAVEKAAAGADAMFLLSRGPNLPQHDANAARAAKKAGLKRIVKLSTLGAARPGAALNVLHEEGEKAVRESGVAWTLLRPGPFMSNALGWAGTIKSQGKIFAAYGNGKLALIHPRDIASIAAKALTTRDHEGNAYPLTGGEALSLTEQAKILAELLGKPVEYVPIDDDAARAGMLKAGLPPPIIESMVKLGVLIREGGLAPVLPTVEKLLGRKPLTFLEWAQENAAAFR